VVLSRLQALLGRIYDVEPPLDPAAYLVTDPSMVRDWQGEGATDEALFLHEHAGDLEVSLYLDGAVLSRLEDHDPFEQVSDANLQDCCTALEGVSHLLYIAWSAMRGRCVSLLELETQAEVDKFAALLVLGSGEGGEDPARLHARLHAQLFGRVRYADGLDHERLLRYANANRLAARYCQRLARRWLGSGAAGHAGLFRELHAFYRLGHGAKLACAAG
jgi:hypothetical protein